MTDRSPLSLAAKACYEHAKAFSQDAKPVSLVTVYKTVFTFRIRTENLGKGVALGEDLSLRWVGGTAVYFKSLFWVAVIHFPLRTRQGRMQGAGNRILEEP